MSTGDPQELAPAWPQYAVDGGESKPTTAAANTERAGTLAGGPLIPRGGFFEGQVAIVGPTRIEGSVRGSIRGHGDLEVGPEARIEGRIECDALASEGEIVGPVRARTRARFEAGARLDGDLEVPVMSFDEAAVWNGRATIGAGGEGAGEDGDPQSA